MFILLKRIAKKYFFYKKNKVLIKLNVNISFDTKLSKGVHIEKHATISNSIIGLSTYIGGFTRVFSSDIGNYCSIGPDVLIGENEHILSNFTTCNSLLSQAMKEEYADLNRKRTIIQNDVWIGARALVKKGITISNGSVIAAHAVVTKNVPPYAIVAGVPAKIIGFRFEEDIAKKLIDSNWFSYDAEKIIKTLNKIQQSYSIDNFTKEISIS